MSSEKNKPVRMAFSLRLALIYTVALCISLAALFAVTYQLVRVVVQNRDHEVISAQTSQFKSLFERGGVQAIASHFSQQVNPSPESAFVRIIDQNNQVRFITVTHQLWNLLDKKTGGHLPTNPLSWNELFREENSGSWIVGTTPLAPGLYLQVGRNNTESRLVLSNFRKTAFNIFLPAVFFSLLTGWLVTRSALAPLHALIDTVRHILATGDLQRRVPSRTNRGELDALTTMFNRMLDQNEKLIRGSRETLDNVAHDLRTPMTHLRNSAERALQLPENEAGVMQDALADCVEESEQILHMLNALMDLAEAGTGSLRLDREEVSLHELAGEVIELYSLLAEERRIELKNDVPTECTVSADRIRLRQCIANLIDNALKYSPDGSSVTLTGSSEDNVVTLSVQDHGQGIAQEDLPKIWDRLYRAEQSRTTPGLGLGLSLVRAIIEAHGGTIDVQSEPDRGSIFTLRLPKN
ncbi:MAG: ATP-binding protein [Kiritimatiellales bacterium]|nr:ATP-binding protein [Kiritimatiellales bacterium]